MRFIANLEMSGFSAQNGAVFHRAFLQFLGSQAGVILSANQAAVYPPIATTAPSATGPSPRRRFDVGGYEGRSRVQSVKVPLTS